MANSRPRETTAKHKLPERQLTGGRRPPPPAQPDDFDDDFDEPVPRPATRPPPGKSSPTLGSAAVPPPSPAGAPPRKTSPTLGSVMPPPSGAPPRKSSPTLGSVMPPPAGAPPRKTSPTLGSAVVPPPSPSSGAPPRKRTPTLPPGPRPVLRPATIQLDPLDVAIDVDDPKLPGGLNPESGAGRSWRLVVGGLALVIVVGVVGFFLTRGELGVTCDDGDGELAGVWDAARREALQETFAATRVSFAETSFERFAAGVDAYTSAWREARRAVCETRGELRVRQLACLQRRRFALKSLVDTLAHAAANAVEKAMRALGELPPVAACRDAAALAAAPAPPDDPQLAAEIDRLREQLEPARVALALHKIEEGLATAGPILARAHRLGYVPFEAEVAGVVGALEARGNDLEAAEQTLLDAVWRADQARDDELLAEHMAALVDFVAVRRGRPDDAVRWRRHADTARARLPGESQGQARLLRAIAGAVSLQGNQDEALALGQKALAIAEELYGVGDVRLREALIGLGDIALARGDLAGARSLHERVLTIHQAALGDGHPLLGDLLGELGAAAARAREYDLALEYRRRALEIHEAALGKSHPALSSTLTGIATLLTAKNDLAAARPILERNLALDEKRYGAEHPAVAIALVDLARLADRLGDTEAGRAHGERALAIGERVFVADDPHLAAALEIVGSHELLAGKATDALPRLEQALAIREARAGDVEPLDLAQSRYRLATALRALGRDSARQQELATQAVAGLRAADPERHAELIAEIERWQTGAPAPAPGKKGKKGKKSKKTKKKPKKKKK